MKVLLRKTLAVAVVSLGVTSYAYAQQRSPKDVLPPTPDRPPVSPTLTVITPSSVNEASPNRITVTPLAPAQPVPSTPGLPQPGVVGTNTALTLSGGQPVPSGAGPPSPWDRTNAVRSSQWDKNGTIPNAPSSAAKPAPDPWSTPPANSRVWDSTAPLSSSGTKSEWK